MCNNSSKQPIPYFLITSYLPMPHPFLLHNWKSIKHKQAQRRRSCQRKHGFFLFSWFKRHQTWHCRGNLFPIQTADSENYGSGSGRIHGFKEEQRGCFTNVAGLQPGYYSTPNPSIGIAPSRSHCAPQSRGQHHCNIVYWKIGYDISHNCFVNHLSVLIGSLHDDIFYMLARFDDRREG